jgi:hypothetical protein
MAQLALFSAHHSGAGSDIWTTFDGFFFVFQPLSGDGEIVARVLSEQNTHQDAKAGIDIRAVRGYLPPLPDSAHVILDVKPDGGVEFMKRASDDSDTTFLGGGSASFPVWLKLTHAGSMVIGSMSSDGQAWTEVGRTSFESASSYVGLAVTSHDKTLLNLSVFDNAAVRAGAASSVIVGFFQPPTKSNFELRAAPPRRVRRKKPALILCVL